MSLKLETVIAAHKNYAHFTSLRTNLGDGFLYHYNPVFRNVRRLFLNLGYRFTTKDFCQYQTFPLIALPAILKAKCVPYSDNYTALARIECKSPGRFNMDTVLVPKGNYLLHESCHCVADAVFDSLSGPKGIILRSILCESLANAVEAFACINVKENVHRTLYNFNSYTHAARNDPQIGTINRALLSAGPANTFKVLFFSFVYANFLYKKIDEHRFQEVIGLLRINSAKTLFPVFRLGVRNLDFSFRVKTSGFYFRHFHGLHRSIYALTQFDFVRVLEKTPSLLAQLNKISDFIVAGSKQP